MANLRLKMVTGAPRDEVKADMQALIAEVAERFSPAELRDSAERRRQTEFRTAREYLDRKTPAFRCTQLQKSFGKDFSLGPIDLEIARGDITAVVGENGNGKTTLFRLIAGQLARDSGEIEYPFCSQPASGRIDWRVVKESIAYVPQELPPWRANLLELLEYEAATHGVTGQRNLDEVSYVVERLGLRDHLKKSWSQLSGGYKFRFALARALVWQPTLMVLDEPLANLDVKAQLTVLRDIKSMAVNVVHPIAIFVSSQHLNEIEAIADNVVFLAHGRPLFNDRRALLGNTRRMNLYELQCDLKPHDLTRVLARLPVSIAQDGLNFVLSTAREVSPNDMLQALLQAGVAVTYFRDISRSTKRLFTTAVDVDDSR